FEQVPLGDVCEMLAGNAWPSKRFQRNPEGLPLIRIQNVGSDGDYVYWPDAYAEKYVVGQGELLLSLSGSFRIAAWAGPRALLNQRVLKLTPGSHLSADWLRLTIGNRLEKIADMGRNAVINNVSIADIKGMKIPL